MKRVLVCGGRAFGHTPSQRLFIFTSLDKVHVSWRVSFIIAGAAQGADSYAIEWAKWKGIDYKEFPANWRLHGHSAGPIRNKQMIVEGMPDMVVAFPGGKGTANMINQALKANIHVLRYEFTL